MPIIWIGPTCFDASRHELRSEGAGITKLTSSESVLLGALAHRAGIVPHEMLRVAMGAGMHNASQDHTIYVYICRLRPKLAPHGITIKTWHNIGLELIAGNVPTACPTCGSEIT